MGNNFSRRNTKNFNDEEQEIEYNSVEDELISKIQILIQIQSKCYNSIINDESQMIECLISSDQTQYNCLKGKMLDVFTDRFSNDLKRTKQIIYDMNIFVPNSGFDVNINHNALVEIVNNSRIFYFDNVSESKSSKDTRLKMEILKQEQEIKAHKKIRELSEFEIKTKLTDLTYNQIMTSYIRTIDFLIAEAYEDEIRCDYFFDYDKMCDSELSNKITKRTINTLKGPEIVPRGTILGLSNKIQEFLKTCNN